MGNASAIPGGRAKSARYDTTNVRFQIVTATGTALTGNVHVSEAIKANFARKSIVLIPLVQATVFVSKVLVFARKVGRDWIVELWTRMRYNVCRIALVMAPSMWTHKLVRVTRGGREMTALRVS